MIGLLPIYRLPSRLARTNLTKLTYVQLVKQFSATQCKQLRSVKEETKENVTVIEGFKVPSPRTPYLVKFEDSSKACPLCKLNMDIKYTDVLILSQFLHADGTVLGKSVTGVCYEQNKKLKRLVEQAQRAGLLSKPESQDVKEGTDPTSRSYKWRKYNVYFTEAVE